MNYSEFKRQLGKAGLTIKDFGELTKLHPNSVSNYAQQDSVPTHLALMAVFMAELTERGVDCREIVAGLELAAKKPRGAVAAFQKSESVRDAQVSELLALIDATRTNLAAQTSDEHKTALGQFMTPLATANFMADMFTSAEPVGECKVLDAGAGIGSLTSAFLARWARGGLLFNSVSATAFEFDPVLRAHLEKTVELFGNAFGVSHEVHGGDFIEQAVALVKAGRRDFTHAILNPPYKKLNSATKGRLLLKEVGIDAANLYAAFVALAVELMAPGGQVVAIIPRSFCNGPYYKPFRELLLSRAAIKQIHLFGSRDKAFKGDGVLQENVIIHLVRDGKQDDVAISTSTDTSFSDLAVCQHPFARIVFPDDREKFIHVPTTEERTVLETLPSVRFTLADLGLKVSTGPVVDFRQIPYLRQTPEKGSVPLLFAGHCKGGQVEWPKLDLNKPNAIQVAPQTKGCLYPNGFYCIVRRFSTKEERRRIVPSVARPDQFDDAAYLGFDNRLNVLHANKQGLSEELAYGLSAYLSTSAVDEAFRRFNGHTQVNATDLRLMKFPSREVLEQFGRWLKEQASMPAQMVIDETFLELVGASN